MSTMEYQAPVLRITLLVHRVALNNWFNIYYLILHYTDYWGIGSSPLSSVGWSARSTLLSDSRDSLVSLVWSAATNLH